MKEIYEGNYYRYLGFDCIYAIITIQVYEDIISESDYYNSYPESKGRIEISEKTSGKYLVEYGSNWNGTEEIAFADTIEGAMIEYDYLEAKYCDGMSKLSEPLENILMKGGRPLTPAQEILLPYIKDGTVTIIEA